MLWILIGLYGLLTIYRVVLSILQIKFIINAKEPVVLSANEFESAAKIAITKQKFEIAQNIYSFFIVALWSIWGVSAMQNSLGGVESALIKDSLLVTLFLAIMVVLNLPFEIYNTFVIDKKFGFSNSTAKLFIVDLIKSLIMILIFGFGVSWVLLLCYELLGASWWIWAFGISFGLILIVNLIYPTLIAPIFNKITPLENSELNLAINELLSSYGFKSSGVYSMDASKRDNRLNAYFGGLGATKRVVLFDTLINKLDKDEIIAVLGHELGHFKHKDIIKNIILMSVVLFILFAIFGNIPDNFYTTLGLESSGGGLFLFFLLYSPLFMVIVEPVISTFSRLHEFGADEFGASKTSKDSMILALKKLAKENKSFPLSHPFYSLVYHSHPTLYERLKRLESL